MNSGGRRRTTLVSSSTCFLKSPLYQWWCWLFLSWSCPILTLIIKTMGWPCSLGSWYFWLFASVHGSLFSTSGRLGTGSNVRLSRSTGELKRTINPDSLRVVFTASSRWVYCLFPKNPYFIPGDHLYLWTVNAIVKYYKTAKTHKKLYQSQWKVFCHINIFFNSCM